MLFPHNATFIDKFITDGLHGTMTLRNFYRTILTRDADSSDHIIRIPVEDSFLKYRLQLEETVQIYEISEELFYKPKTVSMQIYQTTEMWLSLLRVNGMLSVADFNIPEIRVYNPDAVQEILGILFKREGKIN